MSYAYDFVKAKAIIDETGNIARASLGMKHDWFWTAETVWEDGEYKVNLLDPEIVIAGLRYSCIDFPILQIEYKDGKYEDFDVGREISEEEEEKEHEIARKSIFKHLAEAEALLQEEENNG